MFQVTTEFMHKDVSITRLQISDIDNLNIYQRQMSA